MKVIPVARGRPWLLALQNPSPEASQWRAFTTMRMRISIS